ncbi:ATP-dependent Clp protease proteolytic subunit [Viridibacillus sp. NPDC093762]|uniref:ATP-dependent Clp protease proteolytic subunit n=1 Tax=Viridibacillus sp. NPDC093762 TaxID=3390720 RepID=UPI003D051702
MLDLNTFANGALAEKANTELQRVIENIADPNTSFKSKRKVTTDIISHIDGVAASSASVLPMISKRIIMPANEVMMIHHAMTGAWENAKQLRKSADDVERISKAMCQHYLDRAGDKMTEEKL